jgi:hypothetical protein
LQLQIDDCKLQIGIVAAVIVRCAGLIVNREGSDWRTARQNDEPRI